MKVYKFGGASVKSADGVRNLLEIISGESEIFIIVSAMGKTTNALEAVLESFYAGDRETAMAGFETVKEYHDGVMGPLFGCGVRPEAVKRLYEEFEKMIGEGDPASAEYELWYDRMVSYGELISTTIIAEFLNRSGKPTRWVDMRRCFVTDSRHKDADIDIAASAAPFLEVVRRSEERVFIGQGFIGGAPDGETTTLGREGSDYSAAVAANILDAESVSIWKDVEGILNGDPKIFDDVQYIPELTYLDAIELAYSGAQIIHPKTIKPLQNKSIPLYVRPFGDKTRPGSVIKGEIARPIDLPILILKRKQVLISIRPMDFSFVLENRRAAIFAELERYNIKVNLIQSSAVNLSICVDTSRHLAEVVERLKGDGYRVVYNDDMELLTIRGYNRELIDRYAEGDDIYMSQRTRRTVRIVRKSR